MIQINAATDDMRHGVPTEISSPTKNFFDHARGSRFLRFSYCASLISERVTAGMKAAEARGKHLGRRLVPKSRRPPPTAPHVVSAIVELATSTDLSIRQIQAKIAGRASRTIVGEITKRARFSVPAAL